MNSPFLFIFIFSAISLNIAAQEKNKIDKSIDNNGKIMLVKINASTNGKHVHYKKSFEVNGLNKIQKDSIVNHILDSLGLPPDKRVANKTRD